MNKVLVYQPFAGSSLFFGIALELIQKHIESGDKVVFVGCDSGLMFCEINRNHNVETCLKCLGKKTNGLSLVEGEFNHINKFFSITQSEKKYIRELRFDFKNIEELKQFKIDGVDLGMAATSSLISLLRVSNPDLDRYKDLGERILKSSIIAYFSFRAYLKEEIPDLVYMHNGRFAITKGLMRLCQKNNIQFNIFDRGSNPNRYLIVDNADLSDRFKYFNMVNLYWDNCKEINQRVKIADEYFYRRQKGLNKEMSNFTGLQIENLLPQGFDKNKRNITIFTSSNDEFAAVGDTYNFKPFESQFSAIQYIDQVSQFLNEIDVYVRIHPNTDIDSLVLFNGLTQSKKLRIIPFNSEVSSYELVKNSNLIITFGSTIGVEANYLRKPHILIGSSFYEYFNVQRKLKNKEELVELMINYQELKPILDSQKWAFYNANFGIPFKFYKGIDFNGGTFKGESIQDKSIISKLYKNLFIGRIIKYYFNKNLQIYKSKK